jgi:hypothetical protein
MADRPGDLMAQGYRDVTSPGGAVEVVEVRPAHSTRRHGHDRFAVAGRGFGDLLESQPPGTVETQGSHGPSLPETAKS